MKIKNIITAGLFDGGRQRLVTICVKDGTWDYWTQLETCAFGRIVVPMLGLFLDYS